MSTVSTELLFTALTALFTGILWVPIILNRLIEMGPWKALKNPEPDVRPVSNWAYRLSQAHRNAIENLAVFAPLALSVHILGLGNALTTAAAMIFLFARIAHAVIYTFGIPLFRTIAFAIGFACQMIFGLRVLGLI
ncbi:MAG: MAPEG family protein [Amylibacter sp.]|nr:MAPEG family protein [Amylibacter sp.]